MPTDPPLPLDSSARTAMSAWNSKGLSEEEWCGWRSRKAHLEKRQDSELIKTDSLPPKLGVRRVPKARERPSSIPPQVTPERPVFLDDFWHVRLDAVLEQRVQVRTKVL